MQNSWPLHPVAWHSVSVAKLLLERAVGKETKAGLAWHFQDLVSRRSTAAAIVSVGSGEHVVVRQHSWHIWKGIGAGAGLVVRRESNRESNRKEANLSD